MLYPDEVALEEIPRVIGDYDYEYNVWEIYLVVHDIVYLGFPSVCVWFLDDDLK